MQGHTCGHVSGFAALLEFIPFSQPVYGELSHDVSYTIRKPAQHRSIRDAICFMLIPDTPCIE